MLANEGCQSVYVGGPGLLEGVHQPQLRVLRRERPLGDPGEQLVQRTLGPGMDLAQQVPVGPAVAVAVLDCLVDGVSHWPGGVPAGDGPPQAPAPAAHGVDMSRELVQVAAGAGHPGQGPEGQLPGLIVAVGGGQGQGEQGWGYPGGAALLTDGNDLPHGGRTAGIDTAPDHLSVLQGQLSFGGVVAAALGAQDQEPAQPGEVVHRVGVAPGAVGDHAGQRLGLGRRGQGDTVQVGHVRFDLLEMGIKKTLADEVAPVVIFPITHRHRPARVSAFNGCPLLLCRWRLLGRFGHIHATQGTR